MKKIIRNFFRNIEQKNKLDLITELLILENSTPEALQLFEKVKANFTFEMRKREKQAAYDCHLINKLSDPNFDRPINEIKVNL